MLSFAEEIYLLALNEATGKLEMPSDRFILDAALLGAVLGELSFLDRIDSDLQFIHILSTRMTQDPVLDKTLASLGPPGRKIPITECLAMLLPDAGTIKDQVLDLLIQKKIVKKVEERIFWVIPSRRYPVIDNFHLEEIEARLKALVLGNTIPDPRETVLVSLVQTCGLFQLILSPRELRRHHDRIHALAKMDAVVRNIGQLILEVNRAFWKDREEDLG